MKRFYQCLVVIAALLCLFGVWLAFSDSPRDLAYAYAFVIVGCGLAAIAASGLGDIHSRDAHDRLARGLREEAERRRRSGRPHG